MNVVYWRGFWPSKVTSVCKYIVYSPTCQAALRSKPTNFFPHHQSREEMIDSACAQHSGRNFRLLQSEKEKQVYWLLKLLHTPQLQRYISSHLLVRQIHLSIQLYSFGDHETTLSLVIMLLNKQPS